MSSQSLPEIWSLIRQLRVNPNNEAVQGELERIADESESDRIKDFIASKIYEINNKIIYPYGARVAMLCLMVS